MTSVAKHTHLGERYASQSPFNNCFRKALSYCTYRLDDKWYRYNDEADGSVARCAKRLHIEMKSLTSDSLNLISILLISVNF